MAVPSPRSLARHEASRAQDLSQRVNFDMVFCFYLKIFHALNNEKGGVLVDGGGLDGKGAGRHTEEEASQLLPRARCRTIPALL